MTRTKLSVCLNIKTILIIVMEEKKRLYVYEKSVYYMTAIGNKNYLCHRLILSGQGRSIEHGVLYGGYGKVETGFIFLSRKQIYRILDRSGKQKMEIA